ncbi:uncharacterized protein LOC108146321 [Drosophila elegans]|uniref:uncharacterized protein LOC108146321 n=1 Tax=Drosophila elegans TaxID=30023 RepID=UPI0007E687FC|nr:uncharacterized protein LOC108146321 [Drosophila elegans]
MADVSLIVWGSPAVHLEPDIIYRIGRKKGLEISVADESMELAHATACILRRGVVRLAALVGKIFVNDQEKSVVDIGKEDAFAGKVKVRFGNVEARLDFKEENDEDHDSSGFGECLKDRQINSTMDSFDIPETQPPSANSTANTTADSFFIPETQAVNFQRTSTSGKVSLGDDFMIPETQDMLAELPSVEPPSDPVINHQDVSLASDAEDSSAGSEIRMCTQDYNEDAIDDFDSSQIICDAMLPLPPPRAKETLVKKEDKPDQLDATDFEMSTLNWTAGNSKCGALSSTKADVEAAPPRGDACITPDLSAPSESRPIHTPDLYDLILGSEPRAGSCSPDPFVRPAERANASGTPQFGGIKQLVVATIETPTATPDKEDAEINQDLVATQRFPGNKLLESDSEDDEEPNQDFVATQAFNLGRRPQLNEVSESSKDEEPNQDFVATQAFNLAHPQPKSNINETCNQDFIATQVFPANIGGTGCQDFIETQPFQALNMNFLSLLNKENIPSDSAKKTSGSKSLDEIDAVLDEMISGKIVTSPVNPNEDAIQFFKPCVIKDKNHYQKICQIEGVFSDISNKSRWRSGETSGGSRKRVARSESPSETPSRKNRRISEGSQRLDSNLRKRRANSTDKKSEPLNKSICKEHEIASIPKEKDKDDKGIAPFKSVANKWQARRSLINNRSDTPGKSLKINQVEAELQDKSKDDLSTKKETRKSGRKSKNVETNKADTSKDVPRKMTRTRSKTVDDDDEVLSEKAKKLKNANDKDVKTTDVEKPVKSTKGRKAKTAEISKPDTSKDLPMPVSRSRRKTTEEVAETSNVDKGKKAKKAENSKANLSKDMSKPMSTTKRQTSEEDAEMSSAEKERKAKSLSKDMPKPMSKTSRKTIEEDAATSSVENDRKARKADSSKDISKQTTRPKRKVSVEHVEAPKAEENPVKSEKVRKTRNLDKNKADTSKDMPKTMTRSRRQTIVEEAESVNEDKPMDISLKRAVVRLPRASLEQIETSSNSGVSSRVTRAKSRSASIEEPSTSMANPKAPVVPAPRAKRAVKSGSATPSVDEVIATSASDKKPTKSAAVIENPSTSSAQSKKAKKTLSNEVVPMNRSGATTTRLSQPDPDPLKAFNLYVKKAKSSGKIKIAFTMCDRPALQSVLKSLKHVVEVTEDPAQCDLLIMDKGERTFKFLMAIASSKPVLSTSWLHSIKTTRSIDVKADHLFSDANFEEKFKFNPLSVLNHSHLLSGFHFLLGEDIIPVPNEMKVIIQSAGGKVHIQPPSLAFSVELYVVTTNKDTKSQRRLRNHDNVHFIKTEGIMQALVQHNAKLLDEHKLKL